jgi:hypothetical protein
MELGDDVNYWNPEIARLAGNEPVLTERASRSRDQPSATIISARRLGLCRRSVARSDVGQKQKSRRWIDMSVRPSTADIINRIGRAR